MGSDATVLGVDVQDLVDVGQGGKHGGGKVLQATGVAAPPPVRPLANVVPSRLAAPVNV